MADLQPDVGEVLQEEAPYVMQMKGCVTVQGPVRTQELPRKGGANKTRTVGDLKAVQVLEADKRRGWAVLISMDQEMYVSFTETSMEEPSVSATVWPKGVPFEVPASVDVWVKCAATGQSTRVSVATALWAEG